MGNETKLSDETANNDKANVSGSETWLIQQESRMKKEMQEQAEYLFGLTHYDWMYRATGDKKYLEEQLKYIEEHKAKFNYR